MPVAWVCITLYTFGRKKTSPYLMHSILFSGVDYLLHDRTNEFGGLWLRVSRVGAWRKQELVRTVLASKLKIRIKIIEKDLVAV